MINIEAEEFEHIIDRIKKNTTLEINFSSRFLTPKNLRTLCHGLQTNTSVRSLHLSNIKIGSLATISIVRSLRNDGPPISLILRANEIDWRGAAGIAEILRTNRSIVSLDLQNNKIDSASAIAFAKALETNQTLVSLDLGNNKPDPTSGHLAIDKASAIAFAEMLKINCTLTFLNLEHSQIASMGLTAIAEALKTNQSLMSLNVEGSLISSVGGRAVLDMLERNRTLTFMNLKDNMVDIKTMTNINQRLMHNMQLKREAFIVGLGGLRLNSGVNVELSVIDKTKTESCVRVDLSATDGYFSVFDHPLYDPNVIKLIFNHMGCASKEIEDGHHSFLEPSILTKKAQSNTDKKERSESEHIPWVQDFSGADLSGANFSGVNFSGVDFSMASISSPDSSIDASYSSNLSLRELTPRTPINSNRNSTLNALAYDIRPRGNNASVVVEQTVTERLASGAGLQAESRTLDSTRHSDYQAFEQKRSSEAGAIENANQNLQHNSAEARTLLTMHQNIVRRQRAGSSSLGATLHHVESNTNDNASILTSGPELSSPMLLSTNSPQSLFGLAPSVSLSSTSPISQASPRQQNLLGSAHNVNISGGKDRRK